MVVNIERRGKSGPPRPTGPFAALAGSSRQAAWRRTLARRLVAGVLVGFAVLLLLIRPGPLATLAADPPARDRAGSGAVGGTADGGGQEPAAAEPAGAAGALAVVRIGGLRGANSVPPDALGISVPAIDDSMAARLRPGDVVDVYASGRKSPVARAARVIEVIAFRATRSGVSEDGGTAPPPAGGARVFLAASTGDVARVVSAVQAGDSAAAAFWFAVRAAPDQAASAR